jgi:hypothetical protein
LEVGYFHYADGKKRDAEALMVDASGTVWLIDKDKHSASLFRAKFARGLKGGATLKRVATRKDIRFVTAADLSADGRHVVVRNLENAYEFSVAG